MQLQQPITINNWLKVYLIGAMSQTQANDEGRGWREVISAELLKRLDANGNPLYLFNPVAEEQSKVGLSPKAFHAQLKVWAKEGNHDEIAKSAHLIWNGKTAIEADRKGKFRLVKAPGDFDYVEQSDMLICRIEEQDRPCGTYFEAGYGMKLGIPIYVLQTMPIEKYSESFLGWVYGSRGEFFDSQEKLLKFLDRIYNLTVKE